MSFENTGVVLNKKLGPAGIVNLQTRSLVEHPRIPSGSLVVDYVTGIGGIPRGKITELHGLQSSGKTTASLMTAAECQYGGEGVLFIDHENSFVPEYAVLLGVDLSPSKFALYQPHSMEDGFRVSEFYMQQGGCGMVIQDSVAAMVPQDEVDGEIGDTTIGLQARKMSQALRMLKHLINTSNTAYVFINQLRDVVDISFGGQQRMKMSGPQFTTPGGRALKFFADLRLEFMPSGVVKAEGSSFLPNKNSKDADVEKVVTGVKSRVTAIKNKCAAPFRSAEIFMRTGKGIDNTIPCVELALKYQLIRGGGSGGYYKIPQPYCSPQFTEESVQGREVLNSYFDDAPDRLQLLYQHVWENVRQGGL